MGVGHSPDKLAPIFVMVKSATKRKNSDAELSETSIPIEVNSHAEPKRLCMNSESEDGEVTNSMILQAITSLSNRIDNIETKLATMVDNKVAEVEKRVMERVTQVTKTFQIDLQVMEDDVVKRMDTFERDLKIAQNKADQSASTVHFGTELRIDLLERQARSNELVLSGVPKVDNENLSNIYQDVCKAIDFKGSNCVQQCFRLPQRNDSTVNSNRRRTPSIILKFWNGEAKADFFKHYIRKKNLCVTNIGFSAPARIYVNENLTKKNFEIFQLP